MTPGAPGLEPRPLADAAVRRLWACMTQVYGHRWTSQYGHLPPRGGAGCCAHPAMATWARGLAGVGPRGLELGLSKTVRAGGPWPPTLPEFRALCRPAPADFGLPEAAAALEGAERARRGGAWPHPAVRVAAEAAFALPWPTIGEREAAFRRAYRHVAARVMAGGAPEPPPAAALGPPPEPPACRTEARRHLGELRAVVGLAPEARERTWS